MVVMVSFRKLLSIYVFSYFPFGFEGRMWDLIVSVPDHCLSFYFDRCKQMTANVLILMQRLTAFTESVSRQFAQLSPKLDSKL